MSYFFFFQAEDGIRDTSVTGVQTCALPISKRIANSGARTVSSLIATSREMPDLRARSEERRVGKECRYRWSPYHEKKKQSEPRQRRARIPQDRDRRPDSAQRFER